MKKIARWRYCWNICHLSVKTKISSLVVCYQGSNGCLKNQQDLRNLDLEVYCANMELFQWIVIPEAQSKRLNKHTWMYILWQTISIDCVLRDMTYRLCMYMGKYVWDRFWQAAVESPIFYFMGLSRATSARRYSHAGERTVGPSI